MSDAERWKEMIAHFERKLGRPLSAEERAELEKVMPEVEKQIAKVTHNVVAAVQFEQELAAFFEKLITRQGSILPDFDALYEKKAEIDHRLLEGEGE